MSHNCWCGASFKSRKGLLIHLKRSHGQEAQEQYFDAHLAKPCEMCGKLITFRRDASNRRFCSLLCARRWRINVENEVGANSPLWRGGKTYDPNGYACRNKSSFSEKEWQVIGPMFGKNRNILEHRAVKALELGRALRREEVVHHINNVRDDNRPENLEIWIKGHNAGFSSNVSMRCPCCSHTDIARSFLEAM